MKIIDLAQSNLTVVELIERAEQDTIILRKLIDSMSWILSLSTICFIISSTALG